MNGEDISIFKHDSHSITGTFGSSAQARLASLSDDAEPVNAFGSLAGYLGSRASYATVGERIQLAQLGEFFGVRASGVRQVSLRN